MRQGTTENMVALAMSASKYRFAARAGFQGQGFHAMKENTMRLEGLGAPDKVAMVTGYLRKHREGRCPFRRTVSHSFIRAWTRPTWSTMTRAGRQQERLNAETQRGC